MATVRTVVRGNRSYRYLVQSYRWNGRLRKKERYLGTTTPKDLRRAGAELDRAIWEETWFPLFDSIRRGYRSYLERLPPTIRTDDLRQFVLEFTYDTNRIEGSTLSLDDTRALLERGVTPGNKPLNDVLEAQSHARLVERLIGRGEMLDLRHLLLWHRELFGQTKPDIAGRLRDYEVRIRGSRYVPPSALEVRPMLLELLRWVRRSRARHHPVERAAEFHWRFEHLHPFGDGNGRVGRLAMNLLLGEEGFPMLNVRYKGRRGYYRALETSSLRSDVRPFLHWFFLRFARENSHYVRPPRRASPDARSPRAHAGR